MADPRIELLHIQEKGFDWYQQQHGEAVLWYEFDAKVSEFDNVFEEAGNTYRPAIPVPVLWIIPTEVPQTTGPEGRRNVTTARFAVPMRTLRKVGLSDPWNYERHLLDLFLYEDEYFSIGEYSPKGRMWREDVIVAVNGVKVFPEQDLVGSDIPDFEMVGGDPPTGRSNDTYQSWPYHERPAEDGQTPTEPT